MPFARPRQPSLSSARRRRLTAAVRWPVFILLGAIVFLLVLAVWQLAGRSDALALQRQREVMDDAITAEIANVANTLSIGAYWDDPILRLRAPDAEDLEWAHALIGKWLHDRFGHDRVYILDAEDQPIYAMRDGRSVQAQNVLANEPNLSAFVDELRGRRSAVVGAREITRAYGNVALPDHVADVVRVEGRPAVAVVMKSKPLTDPAMQAAGEELVFISVLFLDEGFLAQLKQRHGLDVTRFSRFPEARPGEETDAVTNRHGEPVGYIFWRPDRPGASVIKAITPAALAALIAVLVGLALFVRNLQRIDLEMSAGESALREALGYAEAASQAKSVFLANMSHEIRTPLNGVVAAAELLAGADLNPREKELVDLVRGSSANLTRLLSDILDLSRIEAGRLVIEETSFDLADAVRGVAALAELQANEKGLAFEVAIEAPDRLVLGDPGRLKQILHNLLSNAVKFTHEGKVSLKVTTDAAAQPPVLRITVSDTGVGFTDEQRARLFDRFEQADTSITRRFGGSGLGLAITHALVSLMGGRIEASGSPNAGAAFALELPLRMLDPAPAALAQSPAAPELAPAAEDERSLCVLVAEDNPTNRRVIELILGAAGAELTCVENGAEAVDTWMNRPFDLVLMDMQMPVMDGLTATRTIRARERELGRPRTPIVFVTANAMTHHAEACLAAGGDLHLEKPLTAETLFGAIETALAQGPLEDPGLSMAQSGS